MIKTCNSQKIIIENNKDLDRAKEEKVSSAIIDRLMLNDKRIEEMAKGLYNIAQLPDPVGEIVSGWKLPNGLNVNKVRVPLGVIGIIYEGRPNVTVDAAALCVKTGNAVILRGSSSAIHQYVDVLIPRGGAGLIKTVVENSTVPVIETGIGNCHIYVNSDADFNMATEIVINAKTQRPGVCNAAETLLVDKKIAENYLPVIIKALKDKSVTIYGCPITCSIVDGIEKATEEDWYTEYLDLKMAVKVVVDFDDAVHHINKYGSKHSEAIVTKDYLKAKRFTEEVDAAAVYVNASTRFTDGGQFGFGAEIGISTQKLHARGPMGLPELTSTKFVIFGNGQVRK
ncbi:MAG: glutamate-5-semialdehyde dehydrogenase [Actinobacteria bacterium]|nr:glutamate-5-semialdehyde dehydrogenase [Actinomycetota bacterium]